MIGESSHSNSTTSPQYEDIIQQLSSICITSSSVYDSRNEYSSKNPCFYLGELGSHAFVRYSAWKLKRKSQPENLDTDEKLLHLTKTVVQECLERCTAESDSLSVWTNPSFGSHVLLTAIFHQLEQGEASYQELDEVENFLERCIDKISTDDEDVSCNVMNGLAGTLQGIFFVRRELQRPDWAKKEAIRIATEILKRGSENSEARKFTSSAPLYWGSNQKTETDWSMSTGCAGTLQSLLGLEINEWNEIEKAIPNALETLLERTIRTLPCYGNMEYYSNKKNSSGWTMDGAAGHAILLLQSYVVLGSIKYLKQAQILMRTKILPWCSAYMTDSKMLPSNKILGLFDGVVGVCYCLWLSKEKNTARKLINKAIGYTRRQIKTAKAMDLSLASGLSGLLRLLQQIDNRNRDEVDIPFLSSALFNFDMQIQTAPLNESDHDSSAMLARRKQRAEAKQVSRRQTSLPTHTYADSSSGHMRRSYQLSNLSTPKRWTSTSDLDEDSHLSVSSFHMDEKPRIQSSIQFPNMRAKRRTSSTNTGGSASSTSFSLKEEDEYVQKIWTGSSEQTTRDNSGDDSSSFSTSSHMESGTVDDQANPDYLAKQDSDNEEYINANVSVSLLPTRVFGNSDSEDSSIDKSERKELPVDRLSLFARTRNQNLNTDSDSDSITYIEPPVSHSHETPSTSNRKSLSTSKDTRKDSEHSQTNRRSMQRAPKPQMHMWMTASKRNLMAGVEGDEPISPPPSSRSSDDRLRGKQGSSHHARHASNHSNDSTAESMNDDDYDAGANDGLALGMPDELPDQSYLDAHDVSTRSSSPSVYNKYKPNPTQRKTLMDEESHGFSSLTKSQYPSARFLTQSSLQEAENESGSDSLHEDEGTVGDDDLAMGSPDDLPSAAYLAMHDVSTRTRTYDPMRNYNPVPVQKKTLMDEEDHKREAGNDKAMGRKMRSLSEDLHESGSDDDDEGTDGGDGLAFGLPDELPSAAYLDSHDVSTRTRMYDPFTNYKPVSAQKKTLMDEEGHGCFKKSSLPSGSNGSSSRAESLARSGAGSVDTENDDLEDDGMAIGLPDEIPNMAYLDTHDISTRTRSYNPYVNYRPAKAQQKTLMDEEGHGSFRKPSPPSRSNGASSKAGSSTHSASASVCTQDDDFEDDGMAIGLPHEVPNMAYLDTHDISTRTRSYNPYVNYRPAKAQQKTLMDEEGHGERVSADADDDSRSLESMHNELDMNEKPNPDYLARQDSLKEAYFDYRSNTTTMPVHNLLDEEDHSFFVPSVPGNSIDSFVAEEAEKDAEPNSDYLARQDSEKGAYFAISSDTTKLPSHQIDGTDSKANKKSAIEAEIEEAVKNERQRNVP